MQKVIVVLGSENSPSGELGRIAKDRLNKCLDIFSDSYVIACTGGFGKHFNTTTKSHAHYAIEYLKEKGISEEVIFRPLLSGHTVEDAFKIKEFFGVINEFELLVLSSDFHLERVKLIFKEVLKGYNIKFISVKSSLPLEEFNNRVAHEKKAVQTIVENGLYY
jgi:uncharacterized SAM-binding protein YcdF (DUF218 family)|tara:strand:- start:2085 stop:2573 length:489 start_codon:yes stop_codon:yes gene_type:complete